VGVCMCGFCTMCLFVFMCGFYNVFVFMCLFCNVWLCVYVRDF